MLQGIYPSRFFFCFNVEKGESLFCQKDNLGLNYMDAFNESVFELRKSLGENLDNWIWGEIHQTNPSPTLSEFFPGLCRNIKSSFNFYRRRADTPQAAVILLNPIPYGDVGC
ncbi:MAG: hypothetical protein CM1200mP38_7820 [Dehalococcoidia bacterium]|nr:MAG: hypothetical protein CM1200mP38_7820 [Dehalococcoidia bacterium]